MLFTQTYYGGVCGYSITTKAMKLPVPANACGIRGLYILLKGNCIETQHHVLAYRKATWTISDLSTVSDLSTALLLVHLQLKLQSLKT